MLDWTKLTDNPVDEDVRQKILTELLSKREVLCQTYPQFLKGKIQGKRVLDIGVAEHDITHINHEGWMHKYIVENSEYCIGVDIIEELVDLLNKQGYNIKHVDATSETYLCEKFDIVIIGDVIEHVNNPVALLEFAKRHCVENGEIIVSTPNPFYYKNFFRTLFRSTFVANFEHLAWITPSMAMEIGRRAKLDFDQYLFFSKCHRRFNFFFHKRFPEIFRDDFRYIFKIPTKNNF